MLIDLNVTGDNDCCPAGEYDASPYVYLSEAQCKALGITTPPPAGTVMMVTARAVAQSVTQSVDGEGKPDVRMSISLTHMEISAAPSSKASLYE